MELPEERKLWKWLWGGPWRQAGPSVGRRGEMWEDVLQLPPLSLSYMCIFSYMCTPLLHICCAHFLATHRGLSGDVSHSSTELVSPSWYCGGVWTCCTVSHFAQLMCIFLHKFSHRISWFQIYLCGTEINISLWHRDIFEGKHSIVPD